MGPAFNKFPS